MNDRESWADVCNGVESGQWLTTYKGSGLNASRTNLNPLFG
jgi:hypothetical protein